MESQMEGWNMIFVVELLLHSKYFDDFTLFNDLQIFIKFSVSR